MECVVYYFGGVVYFFLGCVRGGVSVRLGVYCLGVCGVCGGFWG